MRLSICTPWVQTNFGKLMFVCGRPTMLYRLGLHEKDARSRLVLNALSLPLLACRFFCAAALLAVACVQRGGVGEGGEL